MDIGTTIAVIVLLVLAALVLILFEILTPTFGPLAALAVAALVGAIWLTASLSRLAALILGLCLLVVIPAYFFLLVRALPRSPIGRKLFLEKVPDQSGAGLPQAPRLQAMVGLKGVADTLLRPDGAVRIKGQRIVATAESGIIEKGEAVKIVAAGETSVIVRRLDRGAEGPPQNPTT